MQIVIKNYFEVNKIKIGIHWKFLGKIEIYFLVCKKKKKPVDFDDELKIGDVRYDNMT